MTSQEEDNMKGANMRPFEASVIQSCWNLHIPPPLGAFRNYLVILLNKLIQGLTTQKSTRNVLIGRK